MSLHDEVNYANWQQSKNKHIYTIIEIIMFNGVFSYHDQQRLAYQEIRKYKINEIYTF